MNKRYCKECKHLTFKTDMVSGNKMFYCAINDTWLPIQNKCPLKRKKGFKGANIDVEDYCELDWLGKR